jgi:hypothetical protein
MDEKTPRKKTGMNGMSKSAVGPDLTEIRGPGRDRELAARRQWSGPLSVAEL